MEKLVSDVIMDASRVESSWLRKLNPKCIMYSSGSYSNDYILRLLY